MCPYKPRYVYWELSNYCNLRCKHCFSDSVSGKESIADEALLRAAIEEMNGKGKFAIRFGGGEPLMVPYLYTIISFCKSLNMEVDMTTNGMLICDTVLSKLYAAGIREVTISVDGLKQGHDSIRGKGSFDRVCRSIQQAISYGKIPISVAFTVMSHNCCEIVEFVEHFVSMGVKKFYFFRYCSNANSDTLQLSAQQLHMAADQIFRLSEKYKEIAFIHEGFAFYMHQLYLNRKQEGCNFLKNVLTIDYRGNVIVCAAIQKVLGNIYTDSISTIYDNLAKEQCLMAYTPDACRQCSYSDTCHGGCKSHSYAFDGTYKNKDALCYLEQTDD